MNKKVIFTWLTLIVFVAVSSCGQPPTPTPTPTRFPAADITGEFEEIIAYTFPGTDNSTEWTIPIKAAPFKKIKQYEYPLPGDWIGKAVPFEVGVVEIGTGPQTQGIYVVAIDLNSDQKTVPGLLASTTDADIYTLSFQRTPQIVNPARTDPPFDSFPQLDPAENPLPSVRAAISADGICFVVNIILDPAKDPVYMRYCSNPSVPGKSLSLLSVMGSFGPQYGALRGSIDVVANRFNLQDVVQTDQIISEMEDPGHLDNCREQILNPSRTIPPTEPSVSKIATSLEFHPPLKPSIPTEDKPLLELSQGKSGLLESQDAIQKACGSDITIAPVTLDYFKEQFKSVQTSTGRRFVMASLTAPVFNLEDAQPVTVAVVQILQPIETSLSVVLPGEYRLDYWFDANEVFYAATISGLTSNGNIVTNQPVPAVPAAFINDPEHADLPEESGAQISASRIFGRCTFFQKSCT